MIHSIARQRRERYPDQRQYPVAEIPFTLRIYGEYEWRVSEAPAHDAASLHPLLPVSGAGGVF